MIAEQKEKFVISLPAKPYVRRFLTLSFGDPANLSKNPRLNNLFRRCLKKPSATYDRTRLKEISKRHYCETIEIAISGDDFYRFGWELTRTDTIAFNREIEQLAKFFMRNTVSTYQNLMSQKEAILKFQERFGFPEDIWTYEAIKKDYFRNSDKHQISILPDIIEKIEDFFMMQLSELGPFSGSELKKNKSYVHDQKK